MGEKDEIKIYSTHIYMQHFNNIYPFIYAGK